MKDIGLTIDTPIANGQIHRVPVAGKKGKPGWYGAMYVNGKIFGSYGNWSTGEKYKFKNGGNGSSTLTKEERAVITLLSKNQREEKVLQQQKVAKKSQKEWERLPPCPKDHPYLVSKGIGPHGARLDERAGDALVIGIVDPDGAITALQQIWDPENQVLPKGSLSKKFSAGGCKKGCCHVIDGTTERIFICEGFSTGASINEATGNKVLVALDAGNLLPVAQAAQKMFSDALLPQKIIIAADNDRQKEKNIGLDKAKEAAEKTGFELVYPSGIEGTDFNDMMAEKGLSMTRDILLNEKPENIGILAALQPAVSIEPRPIEWLWKPMLAKRKFHLLAARGGSAKTTLACDIAARITQGAEYPMAPLQIECFNKGSILFVTTEDEPDDTLVPRFLAAGGDPAKLTFLSSSKHHLDINERPEELETIIENLPDDLALIILDPVTSMTGNANTHVDSNVKRIAGVLSGLAIKHNLTILGIIHFRKGDPTARGNNLIDMVTGSAGWVNSARIALACFIDDKEDIGYFGVIKSNIGPKKCTLEYQAVINDDDVVEIFYSEKQDVNIETIISRLVEREGKEEKSKIRLDRAVNRYGKFFTEHGLKPAPLKNVRNFIKETLGERITPDELRSVERSGGYKASPGGKGAEWVIHPPGCECIKCSSCDI